MAEPLLALKDVGHSFGGLSVLRSVTFDVPEGGIIGLIGPNGSGKTTLFNIVTGYIRPMAGTVTYRGAPLGRDTIQQRGLRRPRPHLPDAAGLRADDRSGERHGRLHQADAHHHAAGPAAHAGRARPDARDPRARRGRLRALQPDGIARPAGSQPHGRPAPHPRDRPRRRRRAAPAAARRTLVRPQRPGDR